MTEDRIAEIEARRMALGTDKDPKGEVTFTVLQHFGFACWRCREPINWRAEATTVFVPWIFRYGKDRKRWKAHTGNTFIVHARCGE